LQHEDLARRKSGIFQESERENSGFSTSGGSFNYRERVIENSSNKVFEVMHDREVETGRTPRS
jgi:hypothetical protein